MRKIGLAAVLAACVCLAGSGCKRQKVRVQATEEEAPQLATTVHTGDPRAATQLVSGFYDIEQNAWRWTAGRFSVLLRVPRGAAEKGAMLKLRFNVPEAVLARVSTVSLAASVAGTALQPETYTQPGEFTYVRELAPKLMTREQERVDFYLDKFLPAGAVDQRELGIIVTSVGFETK